MGLAKNWAKALSVIGSFQEERAKAAFLFIEEIHTLKTL
jgi:hypothetical protein